MFVLVYMGNVIKVDRESEINISEGKVQVSHLKQWRTDAGVNAPASVPSQDDAVIEGRGAHFMEAMPVSKRGRKADPNSSLQRVWGTIRTFLKDQEEIHKDQVIAAVSNAHPNIARGTVITYAMKCPDVERNGGRWSLKSTDESR